MAQNFRYRKTLPNFLRQSVAHSPTTGRMVGVNIPRYSGTTNALNNLLGKSGGFETDSNNDGVADGWGLVGYGSVASLVTNQKGGKSQRITATASDTGYARRMEKTDLNVVANKFYVALVDVLTDGVATCRLNIAQSATTLRDSTSTTANKTHYARFIPPATGTIIIRLYNDVAMGTVGWGQFDNARLYEIDQATYSKIDVDPEYTGEKLAAKFPYTEPDPLSIYRSPFMDNTGKVITIEEATTNILPARADDFVTGWVAIGGATIAVTQEQPDPFGSNKAYRIQTTGGSGVNKYYIPLSGLPNPHSVTSSLWIKVNAGNVKVLLVGGGDTTWVPQDGWVLVKRNDVNRASTTNGLYLTASNASDNLDVTVCYPQVELKTYATSYIAPGTTRAAETYTIPTYGTGPIKNLLTYNQSTIEVDTSGFTVNSGATISRDTTEKYQGASSLKLVTAGTTAAEGFWLTDTIVNNAPKTYTFTFWIKGASGSLYTTPTNQSGSARGSSAIITLNGKWIKIKTPCTTVAGDTSVRLYIRTYTTAQAVTCYVDNIQLEEGSEATYFIPGGYATPTGKQINLLTENASNVEESISSFGGNGTTVSVDTTDKVFGLSSLKVTTSGLNTNERFYTGQVNVTGGKYHAFSVYLKGSGTVNLAYIQYGVGDTGLATLLGPAVTINASTWTRFVFPAMLDANAVKVRATVYSNSVQAVTFWADGFQLEEIPELPRNLLPDNVAGVELSTTGFIGFAQGVISRDTTEKYQGASSLKVVTPGAVANEGFYIADTSIISPSSYTFSFWVKGSGTIITNAYNQGASQNRGNVTTTLTGSWQRVYLTVSMLSGDTAFRVYIRTTTAQAITLWFDCFQFELGTAATEWQAPYSGATAWTPGGMPMPILPVSEGTIEFDINAISITQSNGYVLHLHAGVNNSGTNYAFVLNISNVNTIQLAVRDAVEAVKISFGTTYVLGLMRVAITYTQATTRMYINGVQTNTTSASLMSTDAYRDIISVGSRLLANGASVYPNTQFGNIRISCVERPGSELADTWKQKLTADRYTTYLTDFDQRLSNVLAGA